MNLILASSSPYRAALLRKLGLPFAVQSPEIDETPRAGETPQALVLRLSRAKAAAVLAPPEAWVIACDQVASLEGALLGKPHSIPRAEAQLARCSGQKVIFYNGLTLQHGHEIYSTLEPFAVHFRTLSTAQIRHYVRVEQPLNCAGSFKVEGLGILLFSALEGRDPNALVGLPLLALSEAFAQFGIDLLRLAQTRQ